MCASQEALGQHFVGWHGGTLPFEAAVDLPPDIAQRFVKVEGVLAEDPSDAVVTYTPESAEDDVRLRQAIEDHSGFDDPSGGSSLQEFTDHKKRVWRRSNRLLGSGAFGEVYLGMGIGGDLVALKTMKLVKPAEAEPTSPQSRSRRSPVINTNANAAVEEVLREVSLLSELRDENIVGYIGSVVVHGTLVIIIEYIPGGSLASVLKEFNALALGATQRYVRDIVRGLAFLHKNDVIHRDVKPHNVLLMIDGQCKLTDFGASAKLGQLQSESEKKKVQGTPLYMAPEQCMGNVCKASDVWGVGILTYQLLTGAMPFSEQVLANFNPYMFMYRLGREETFVPTLGEALKSPVAREFCESILKRDPARRPTADDLLSHPFLL